jgi:hypothetical protein
VQDRLEAALSETDGQITWDAAVPDAFRLRECAVLAADFNQLSDALNNLDKQMAQEEARRRKLNMSISFQDKYNCVHRGIGFSAIHDPDKLGWQGPAVAIWLLSRTYSETDVAQMSNNRLKSLGEIGGR